MGRWPLVGRQQELARIATALRHRRLPSLLVVGLPGVGRTRVAEEALRLAAAQGSSTVSVTATRAAATIPFGAFLPLLPAVRDGLPERRLDALLTVRDAILDHAGRRPLVLLVEDAHLLDDASAALVHYLAVTHSAFLIVTVRGGERAADPVLALGKDGLAERVELGPLQRVDVEELLRLLLTGVVDGAAVQAFWERSAGNALFLHELLTTAMRTGTLRQDTGVWRLVAPLVVPEQLRELVAARFDGLASMWREALYHVALGEPLELAILEAHFPVEVLERLEIARLVTISSSGRRSHAVCVHPLEADVLRITLPTARARLVRRRLAEFVERCGARRSDDALRVASWRLESGGHVDPEMLLRAARVARRTFDLPRAERLARLALSSGAGDRAALAIGDVLSLQGRYAEAEALLTRCMPGSDGERVLAALDRAFSCYWGLGDRERADQILLDAAGGLSDPASALELTAARAVHAAFAGEHRLAVELGRSVLEHPAASVRARVRATYAVAPALALTGAAEQAAEVVETARTGVKGERTGSEAVLAALLDAVAALVLAECGRLHEAWVSAQRCYEAGVRRHHATSQAIGAWSLGRVALLQGRAGAALRWFTESSAVERPLAVPSRRRWALIGLAFAAALTRDVAQAGAALAELEPPSAPADAFLGTDERRAHAWTAVAGGDLDTARRVLHVAAADAEVRGELALALASLHDLARLGNAAPVRGDVLRLAGRMEGELAAARALHVDGLAARRAEPLEQAALRFESMGALLFSAEAWSAAADAHRAAGGERRAARSLNHARLMAEQCGPTLSPVLLVPPNACALTLREREIAFLAVTGRTSREIAAQLGLSVRTVDNHLQHVYEKVGVRSRSELRAALARE